MAEQRTDDEQLHTYLLTITDDEGNVVYSHSVEGLTNDQVGSVHAMFTEPERDDTSGQVSVDG